MEERYVECLAKVPCCIHSCATCRRPNCDSFIIILTRVLPHLVTLPFPQCTVADLLQQKAQEYQLTNDMHKEKVATLSDQLLSLQKQKLDLDSLNTKLVEELARKEKEYQEQMLCIEVQLRTKEECLNGKLRTVENQHVSEIDILKRNIEEQSSILKEYQDKVTVTKPS